MIKTRFILFLSLLLGVTASAIEKVYVDNKGIMRNKDNNEEVSYYGVNYTVPFAHAFRALDYLDIDKKEAIDRDVYHMQRLGFNAFRLHIWDVEISDDQGNLLVNEHLDLLDYLITQLEKRGIDIILTAQTNFGNGYPERNINTGAFSYNFLNSKIHDTEEAIRIQKQYIQQLVKHVNPYNNKSYCDDPDIIAIEINNEPIHSGDVDTIKNYINSMVKSIRSANWKKPIFYNVSHNEDKVQAYFDADVQGGTYQWYPVGLVSGYERKGNFLASIDNYDIPFKQLANFDKFAKMVYEYDPADNLYSYIHPAMARTFRKEGFQWITQFSYDPIDMATYNTEYQTHFLNLAYTPQKALSLMIAAEVTRNIPRNADFGSYPNDTIFDLFHVSYHQDLSVMNSLEKYIYTNNTTTKPIKPNALRLIAGYKSSPVIQYEGSGAYFLDQIDKDTWRLEIMPDVYLINDPFEKASLNREVGAILYREHPMTIRLPQLGDEFHYTAINIDNSRKGKAINRAFTAYPGVYLLSKKAKLNQNLDPTFIAPAENNDVFKIIHTPIQTISKSDSLSIQAKVYSKTLPDSLIIYPQDISFWRDDNTLYKMKRTGAYDYELTIPVNNYIKEYKYNIVAFTEHGNYTFPQNNKGTPLSWDFRDYDYYATTVVEQNSPIVLLDPRSQFDGTEVYPIPEAQKASLLYIHQAPISSNVYRLNYWPSEGWPKSNNPFVVIKRYVKNDLQSHPFLHEKNTLVISLDNFDDIDNLEVAIISDEGITYSTKVKSASMIEIPIAELTQSTTYICPAPYPSFLSREFESDTKIPFKVEETEFIQLKIPSDQKEQITLDIKGIWLE